MELFLLACQTGDSNKPVGDSVADSTEKPDSNNECPPSTETELYALYDQDADGYLSDQTPECLLEKIIAKTLVVDATVLQRVKAGLLDCDDTDDTIHPEASEICGDGVNQNCSEDVDLACRTGDLALTDAAKVQGAAQNRKIGEVIAPAGDFNEDGFNDLVLGVPQTDVTTDTGYVLVYAGQNDLSNVTSNANRITITGLKNGDLTGYAVAIAGDVNGDGVGDLLISRIHDDTNGARAGAVELLHGPVITGRVGNLPGVSLLGDAAGDQFGASLLPMGDLSGDGSPEIAVGTMDSQGVGVIPIFEGATVASGTATPSDYRTQFKGEPNDGVGATMATSDFDGDGLPDLFVAAPYADGAGLLSGAVYFFSDARRVEVVSTADVDIQFVGENTVATFGASLYAGEPDYNGDGWPDVVIGEPQNSQQNFNAGAAYVFYGSQASNSEILASQAPLRIEGTDNNGQLGTAVILANYDGVVLSDVFVGAPSDSSTPRVGKVGQVYAPQTGVVTQPNATWQGDSVGDYAGYKLGNLGYVNGDVSDEIAVGAPRDSSLAPSGGAVYLLQGLGE